MPSRHRLGRGEPTLTYEGYLKVPELIALQHLRSSPPEHDELLFIITHQAYELWFRQILFELDGALEALGRDDARRAIHLMRRVAEIERLLVRQIHVLETMTPADFLAFRDRLNPASGFQSVQFREVEFASGVKDARILAEFAGDPGAHGRLRRRFDAPALPDALRALLRGRGIEQPEGEDSAAAAVRLRALAAVYEEPDARPDVYDLCEALLDHDEQIQLWRHHHVRMVERMIGHKIGTGGSEGVAYLERTLTKKCFPDLWAARTWLRPPSERKG
jgi:tryptophan 2,3-dioxygenase